ncbi:MAG: hypothetical protein ACRDN0_22005 [Trebonia sp.]
MPGTLAPLGALADEPPEAAGDEEEEEGEPPHPATAASAMQDTPASQKNLTI